MTRRPSFLVRPTSAEPPAWPQAARGIVLIVALSWFGCVALAWAVAGAVRLVTQVLAA